LRDLCNRILIAAAILIVVLLMLAALTRWLDAEPKEPDLYAGIPLDHELLEMDKTALEQAYHSHIIKLFEIWLTDGAREHSRFTNGLKITRNAYRMAKQQIEQREQQLKK
jgi:hypothetical protein